MELFQPQTPAQAVPSKIELHRACPEVRASLVKEAAQPYWALLQCLTIFLLTKINTSVSLCPAGVFFFAYSDIRLLPPALAFASWRRLFLSFQQPPYWQQGDVMQLTWPLLVCFLQTPTCLGDHVLERAWKKL